MLLLSGKAERINARWYTQCILLTLILLTWLQIKDIKFISFVFIIFLNVEQSAMNCHPLSKYLSTSLDKN